MSSCTSEYSNTRSGMSNENENPHKTSTESEKRCSQWELILRKFSDAHRVECKAVSVDMPRVHRSAKNFPTGSSYEGTWDVLGMSGRGVYTFPNGVEYVGEFNDGMFHGRGELRYPGGAVLQGRWNKGEMVERKLIFDDGLEYAEQDWDYCKMPDRRFTIELGEGLKPAGESYLTAEQPTREIPPGYYDTGDGFFDPKTKAVYKADDLTAIIRSPSVREQKWIIANCRTSPDLPLGPRPDLYEVWTGPIVEKEEVSRNTHANRTQLSSFKGYAQDSSDSETVSPVVTFNLNREEINNSVKLNLEEKFY